MTREETIALWKRCEDERARVIGEGAPLEEAHDAAKMVWNAWASQLLEDKNRLQSSGEWVAVMPMPWSEEWHAHRPEGKNDQTKIWLKKAYVDFSDYVFEDAVDFSGFVFPAEVKFGPSMAARRSSPETVFKGSTTFDDAYFHETVQFGDAIFEQRASFERVNFSGPTRFSRARFYGSASFSRSIFVEEARFGGSEFKDVALFIGVVFESEARFYGGILRSAHFDGSIFRGPLLFEAATFSFYASFQKCRFEGVPAFFYGMSCQSAITFDGAYFEKVPDFSQANFAAAPRLDHITIGQRAEAQTFWSSLFASAIAAESDDNRTANVVARYRALRRLAILGHDHDNEAKAFKGEIRSKRGTTHRWYHAAFWYGLAYDVLSDFGHSMSRPIVVWVVSLFAFAAIYFVNAGTAPTEWFKPCVTDGAPKTLKAITLSLANALPGLGASRTEEAKAFYECLALQHAPAWSPIIQISQTLWSAVLIFLFLLAVRNQFKIK